MGLSRKALLRSKGMRLEKELRGTIRKELSQAKNWLQQLLAEPLSSEA